MRGFRAPDTITFARPRTQQARKRNILGLGLSTADHLPHRQAGLSSVGTVPASGYVARMGLFEPPFGFGDRLDRLEVRPEPVEVFDREPIRRIRIGRTLVSEDFPELSLVRLPLPDAALFGRAVP